MRPGTIIRPRAATVGQHVQGMDRSGVWYNATVLEIAPDKSKVLLTYTGFRKSHDRWHTLRERTVRARVSAEELKKETDRLVHGKLEGRQADGTWEVSSIVGKRKRQQKVEYEVEWVGDWKNSWEPASNLPRHLTTEFDAEERARRTEEERALAKSTAPYSTEVAKGDQASAAQRLLDAGEWATDVAVEAAAVTRRQIRPYAEQLLHIARPCPAWAYVGLHSLMMQWAKELRPHDDVADHVTDISLHRSASNVSGALVSTDRFTVYCDDVVNKLLGPGVLVVQHERNRAAVKLVPPVSFDWRAEHGPTGPAGAKKLTVRGHFVTLVEDSGDASQVIFCTDHERYEYEPTDIHAYKQGMAAALLASNDAAIPQSYLDFANSDGLLATLLTGPENAS